MIELAMLVLVMAIFFAIVGFLRGSAKEFVSTAGIILGLFALFQFDALLRGTLLANVGRDQVFYVQAGLFIIVVFFAYQTRAIYGRERGPGRDRTQDSAVGAILGFFNGYLIWGSLWYFLDINEYPLAPYIIAPAPGSPSDNARAILPLVILGGGASGSGDLLAIAVIALFLIVIVMI